jgi:cell division protein FtsL
MMQRATWLWLAFVLGLGFALFQLKYQVQGLEEKLTRINREILQNEETIHVLKAEWSYLNQHERIEALARKYLSLRPLAGKQYGTFDDLPMRQNPASPRPGDASPSAGSPNAGSPSAGSPSAAAPAAPITPLPVPRPHLGRSGGVTLAKDAQ